MRAWRGLGELRKLGVLTSDGTAPDGTTCYRLNLDALLPQPSAVNVETGAVEPAEIVADECQVPVADTADKLGADSRMGAARDGTLAGLPHDAISGEGGIGEGVAENGFEHGPSVAPDADAELERIAAKFPDLAHESDLEAVA